MKDLKRILLLMEKTGGTYIVEDGNGDAFVVLGLSQYESLISGASKPSPLEDVIARVNHDISMWKNEESERHDLALTDDEDSDDSFGEDKYYFEPDEDEIA